MHIKTHIPDIRRIRKAYPAALLLLAALMPACSQAGNPPSGNETMAPPESIASKIPWDFEELNKAPDTEWLNDTGKIRSLLYSGEPYRGKTTRAFAYYASPRTLELPEYSAPYPGVVLVHGGGGTAFSWWVEKWAKRGYAAIAMDLNGSRPAENAENNKDRKPLPDGAPPHSTPYRIHRIDSSFNVQWQFHAVSNLIRAHSLIRSLKEVDETRTAITGISWGGYLTNMVAGLDNRFNCAVPVYGCGYIQENSYWTDRNKFQSLTPAQFNKWVSLWDPASYVKHADMPMLFVNGVNDPYYYLEIFVKTFHLVPNHNRSLQLGLKHGHGAGAKPGEIDAFIDHYLKGEPPLPFISKPEVSEQAITARVQSQTRIDSIFLVFTSDTLHPRKRSWHKMPVAWTGGKIHVEPMPPDMNIWFLSAKDERGLLVSSDVQFN